MKKLLALVLALVMVMGLSVVSTNAAFNDGEKIDHTEAVEVMNSLNIINGYEDGTYKPDLNVTRAQMAKMVALAMLGEIDPAAFAGAKSDLTDISGHWAEGFIKFCVSQGIVAGRGDGTFDPEANVTTAEAAKMLLVALGYNADVRKYTGSQWTLAVMRDAQQKGLLDDLTKADTNVAMDRDDAAQMIYNTLNTRRVIETQSVNTETGAITLSYVDASAGANGVTADTVNLLGKTFGAKTFIGTMDGNYYTTGVGRKGEVVVTGKLDTDDGVTLGQADRQANFPFDFDIKNIGEEIKVIYKEGTGSINNQPDRKDDIYGVFNTGKTIVYETTKGEMQEASATQLADGLIKFGDATYKVAEYTTNGENIIIRNYGNVNVNTQTIDGAVGGDDGPGTGNAGVLASDFATYLNSNVAANGGLRVNSIDPIKFVCNDEGKIARVYVVDTTIAEVSALSSTNIQLIGQTSKKLEDCEGTDGLKAGDIARFATTYPAANAITRFYGDVAKVEGKITAFNNKDNAAAVQIDGNWYPGNNGNAMTADGYTTAALTAANVGDTVSIIVDGGKYYGAYKVVSGYNDYAIANASQKQLGDYLVNAKLADGTSKSYIIDTDSPAITAHTDIATLAAAGTGYIDVAGSGAGAGANKYGALFAYKLTGSGTKIVLNDANVVDIQDAAGATYTHKYVSSNSTLSVDNDGNDGTANTTLVVDPNANVFLYNTANSSWGVYTASALKGFSFTNNTHLQYVVKSGKVVAFAGVVGGTPTASTTSTAYGYVTNVVKSQNADGDDITVLSVWDGTDNATVTIEGDHLAGVASGQFIRYPVAKDGGAVAWGDVLVQTGGTGLAWGAAKVKAYDSANNVLTVTTSKVGLDGVVIAGTDINYKVTSDTKFIGVKTDDKAGSTVTTPVAYTQTIGNDFNNVYLVTETDASNDFSTVVACFIDEDNKLKDSDGAAAGVDTTTYNVAGLASDTYNTGATATITTNKTGANTVIAGETVTFTLTLGGTSSATTTKAYTVTGATLTNSTLTGSGVAGVTSVVISGGNTITITPTAASTTGTYTFTGVVTGNVSIA